jgi:hypothetical protein
MNKNSLDQSKQVNTKKIKVRVRNYSTVSTIHAFWVTINAPRRRFMISTNLAPYNVTSAGPPLNQI